MCERMRRVRPFLIGAGLYFGLVCLLPSCFLPSVPHLSISKVTILCFVFLLLPAFPCYYNFVSAFVSHVSDKIQGSRSETPRHVRAVCKAASSFSHVRAAFNPAEDLLPPLSKICYRLAAFKAGEFPAESEHAGWSDIWEHVR